MNNHNILLRDITRVSEAIAERFRKDEYGPEAATNILAETDLYTFEVWWVFPEADRQWLQPEVRQAVVAEVVDSLN